MANNVSDLHVRSAINQSLFFPTCFSVVLQFLTRPLLPLPTVCSSHEPGTSPEGCLSSPSPLRRALLRPVPEICADHHLDLEPGRMCRPTMPLTEVFSKSTTSLISRLGACSFVRYTLTRRLPSMLFPRSQVCSTVHEVQIIQSPCIDTTLAGPASACTQGVLKKNNSPISSTNFTKVPHHRRATPFDYLRQGRQVDIPQIHSESQGAEATGIYTWTRIRVTVDWSIGHTKKEDIPYQTLTEVSSHRADE